MPNDPIDTPDEVAAVAAIVADEPSPDTVEEPTEEEVFPREYVEKLRQENGRYRQRAQRAEELGHRLHRELVKATGRLADPTDLPFDETHLDDPDALNAAVEALLESKPHLASRRPTGEIGQGPATSSTAVDLAALLRSRAG